MILTDRDLQIIAALNLCVRMLTLSQIAAMWWSASDTGRKNAAKRLAQLCKAGLLQRDTVLAQTMLALSSPEYAWFPGEPGPVFAELSCASNRAGRAILNKHSSTSLPRAGWPFLAAARQARSRISVK